MNLLAHVGGKVVMLYKWNPEHALAAIEREHVTVFKGKRAGRHSKAN